MEIVLQAASVEKIGISSKRLKFGVVLFLILLPVAVIVYSLYRNSGFVNIEELSEAEDSPQNSAIPLERRVHNNYTVSLVLPGNGTAAEERVTTKNITTASGSKNASLSTSTNDSTSNFVNPDDNDKLLGGLLTSGFDEASCKSRTQFHLLRKASPHKPSPYLVSKLRNYEDLHRRCGPNTKAYHKTMMKIVRSKNHDTATMCKYVIWTAAHGLGNQMISMTATFLYAMLTDRVMLVKFEKDKLNLFCEPFLNSSWILPKNSPYWSWNKQNTEIYQTMIENDKASNSKEGLPSALFINLRFSRQNPERFFHCDHSQDLLRKVPLLILQSDQYFVPSILMNRIFNLEMIKMFPERDTVFHHLARYLFHPSNEAWEQISSYYNTHLAKADEQIGLQIRLFNPSTPKQAIMHLVLRCITKHNILPELDDLQTSTSRKNQTIKAVLVVSLYREFGDNLRSMYLNKPTVSGEVIEVYQPSNEGRQKYNDDKHNMKAWIDMYLLSLSNMLATTSLSTFGYVAQGLGNLKPWLLYRQLDNKTHSEICERDFSSEPCYHTPPRHYCNGDSMTGISSSFPYLRRCRDLYFGVKLAVNSSV
ncbi:hypothetical protein VNO78_16075 [Psophocarpus tetragonolobus]|uniref:Fucosyltransferase n=1 Tax=Psophocarpus tetragonolobus TaxID=3891 RepID=A0AAN9XKG4_PSOTE